MKVFWKKVDLVEGPEGFAPHLDGRPVRTPARAALVLPTRALGEAVAAEWQAQSGDVKPDEMPLTRAANSAIDRVTHHFEAVAADLAAYAETDLLCYRAPHPQELVDWQAASWDPVLTWSAETLRAPLSPTTGVIPAVQPPDSLTALAKAVRAHDPWTLTALYDLVTLTGSLLLGLAVSHSRLAPDEAWRLSRLDEDWNIQEWGEDAEAAALAARKRQAFEEAARLMTLLRKI